MSDSVSNAEAFHNVISTTQPLSTLKFPLVGAFRASPPPLTLQSQLGALGELPGTWVGSGMNIIALPNFANKNLPLQFRLLISSTRETLNFTPIGGPIPNRGSSQPDISFVGVHYLQQVSDAISLAGMHLEPGMWLNLPASTPTGNDTSLARMATIPHGDAILAQGPLINQGNPIASGPLIGVADTTPFTLSPTGARVNEADPTYLAPYHAPANLPPGISAAMVANPNLLLTSAIAGQHIVETTVLRVDANPLAGINGPIVPAPAVPSAVGGISNIPFVNKNAAANTVSAIFWVEKVQDATGNIFMQLQYTQTVILEFIGIKWPHISVATLIKQ